MRNAVKYLSTVLSILLIFSGCEAKPDEILTETMVSENTKLEREEHPLYGVWKLEKVVMKNFLYDSEDPYFSLEKNYVGQVLVYSSGFFLSEDKIYRNPQYIPFTENVPSFTGGRSGMGYMGPSFHIFTKNENIAVDGAEDYDEEKNLEGLPIQCFSARPEGLEYEDFPPVGVRCAILNNDTMLVQLTHTYYIGPFSQSLLARRVK